MIFAKPSLLLLDDKILSDHNRSEVSIDWEPIEKKSRMANGLMRKYFITRKRTFSVQWTDLPHTSFHTVDNGFGAVNLNNYLQSNNGTFQLTLRFDTVDDDENNTYTVMLKDFSMDLKKRGHWDAYDVSLTLEEV